MPGSIRGSISRIIAAIVVSVAILYAADYFFSFLSKSYPVLTSYLPYIHDAISAVVAIGLAVATVRVIGHLIGNISERTEGKRDFRGIFIIIRIIIYAVVIFWFLSSIGVNLEGALVGGAIGGVVIGFAVQSVVSNLLSGIMVSGGGFIKPGDAISIYSWLFGQTITGRVEDVKVLHTRIKNSVGQTVMVPNTALLGSTVFTSLGTGKALTYTITVTLPSDIPADKFMEKAREEVLVSSGNDREFTAEIYLTSKASGSNTYSVVMRFSSVEDLTVLQDKVNRALDRAYWNLKNPS